MYCIYLFVCTSSMSERSVKLGEASGQAEISNEWKCRVCKYSTHIKGGRSMKILVSATVGSRDYEDPNIMMVCS